MALPTTGPTTGLAALIGATVGSSSFWFLAMTLCFIGVTFYAMPPPAIAIEESRKKKKIVKTIATTTTAAAAATAAPATRAKKTSSADMVIESPKPAVTKQAAPLPDSPKSALELLASAPPATDNTASNKRDNKDTEYAFPLSKDASAFSPDPHHALVEAGETQQGFIVCMKGSFGFIRLLSGQSPDDLFFHISALEQGTVFLPGEAVAFKVVYDDLTSRSIASSIVKSTTMGGGMTVGMVNNGYKSETRVPVTVSSMANTINTTTKANHTANNNTTASMPVSIAVANGSVAGASVTGPGPWVASRFTSDDGSSKDAKNNWRGKTSSGADSAAKMAPRAFRPRGEQGRSTLGAFCSDSLARRDNRAPAWAVEGSAETPSSSFDSLSRAGGRRQQQQGPGGAAVGGFGSSWGGDKASKAGGRW